MSATPGGHVGFVRVPPRPGRRGVAALLLLAGFAAALAGVDWSLHGRGLAAAGELLASVARPDLTPSFLLRVARATSITVAYAVAATSVAIAIGLPASLIASGVLARGRALRLVSSGAVRAVLGLLRAIDELVWALLFVNVFGLSPLAGILGIGLPYGATIGRVVAERLQDVPGAPLASLRSAGASRAQVLVYGRLPQAGADLVAYLSYRFECAVRAAAVLSFVGLGGVGFEIQIALDDLRFERVWTLVAGLVVLIALVDSGSARLRSWVAR